MVGYQKCMMDECCLAEISMRVNENVDASLPMAHKR